MAPPRKYSEELRERATRMALGARQDPGRKVGAIKRIADQLGVHPEALRNWVKQAEIDGGDRVVEGTKLGVEPICNVLKDASVQIAPSTYYAAKSRPPSARAVRDERLITDIKIVHKANLCVYGARKIHAELNREGVIWIHRSRPELPGRCRCD